MARIDSDIDALMADFAAEIDAMSHDGSFASSTVDDGGLSRIHEEDEEDEEMYLGEVHEEVHEEEEVTPLVLLEGTSQQRSRMEKVAKSHASARSVVDALGRLEERGRGAKLANAADARVDAKMTISSKRSLAADDMDDEDSFDVSVHSQSSVDLAYSVSSHSVFSYESLMGPATKSPAEKVPSPHTEGRDVEQRNLYSRPQARQSEVKAGQSNAASDMRSPRAISPSDQSTADESDGFSVSVCSEANTDDDFSVSIASVGEKSPGSLFSEEEVETPRVTNRKGLAAITNKMAPIKEKVVPHGGPSSWNPWAAKKDEISLSSKRSQGEKSTGRSMTSTIVTRSPGGGKLNANDSVVDAGATNKAGGWVFSGWGWHKKENAIDVTRQRTNGKDTDMSVTTSIASKRSSGSGISSRDAKKVSSLSIGILPRLSNQSVEDNGKTTSLTSSVFAVLSSLQKGSTDKSQKGVPDISMAPSVVTSVAPSVVTSVRSSRSARSARQLIVDIESGNPSTPSGRGGGKMWAGRRKKVCLSASLFVIVVLGVIGALAGLDIISIQKADDILASMGIGDGDGNPAPAPVPSPEGSGVPWFVDWTKNQCVQDCEGHLHPACGGPRPQWERPHASLRECCEIGFEAYIDEHWSVDECVAVAVMGIEAEIGGPTAWPTMMPTGEEEDDDETMPRPTRRPSKRPPSKPAGPPQAYQASPSGNGGVMYYADWDLKTCIEEDSGKKKPWDVGYKSEGECCDANFIWDKTSDCHSGGDSKGNDDVAAPVPSPKEDGLPAVYQVPPSSLGQQSGGETLMLYYADWDTKKCAKEDSSKKRPWDVGYKSEEDCCESNFLWDEESDCNKVDGSGGADTSQADDTGSGSLYYANFDLSKCLEEDTSGKKPWDVGFESKEECCEANFLWDETSDCYEPAAEGDDGNEATIISTSPPSMKPSPAPTPIPTLAPTSKPPTAEPTKAPVPTKLLFRADFGAGKCIAEEAASIGRWMTGYESENECCQANFKWDENSSCYSGNDNGEGVASNIDIPVRAQMAYYANFAAGKCVLEDSTTKQPWDKSYESEDDCCQKNFGWDEDGGCYVGAAGGSTHDNIAASAPAPQEEGATLLYYGSFQTQKCTLKASNGMSRFDVGYATEEECCLANFRSDKNGDCFVGEVVAASSSVTPAPTSRNSALIPTYVPTAGPSGLNPTSNPSAGPTSRPTGSPVVASKPTESPVVSPTNSPSMPPTPHPTAKPTAQPTAIPVPTSGPSASPTSRMEQLLADLKAASPLSLESLDDGRSDQYRAAEWLSENGGYNTYSNEVKVQRWAMATFHDSLYGEEWNVRDGWMKDTSECAWHGVACNAAGMVTSITMSENNLWGWIPPEVSLLKDLDTLSLTRNFIKGIPPELFGLPNLRVIDLDKNIIEEIPSGIVAAPGVLEELYLSNNEISAIPDELYQLQSVKNLWLSNNKIAASLPTGLGMMKALEELDLESNYFEGSIPTEVYGLFNLQHLSLHDNILTGSFSTAFGRMTNLKVLDLDTNYISGELPTEVGSMTQLSELHLGDNELVGQLPWGALSGLTGLTNLDVSKNYLNSTIGPEIGSLFSLVSLQLDNNYRTDGNGKLVSLGIQGPIPGSMGNLVQLQELRLDNNFVAGAIPATLGNLLNLVTLRLESNNLQSSIPSALGNLSNLQYLHLWSNYLSSTISGQLGKLGQLRELFLDDNEITGTIPPELGQLASVTYVSLADNNIEGVIPPTFAMLSNLDRLDVQFNELFGEIPPGLSSVPLAYMKLEGNHFYGDVPDGICNNIQYLSGNCEVPKQTTRKLASFQALQFGVPQNDVVPVPTPAPSVFQYWWSCNCCTSCFPGGD